MTACFRYRKYLDSPIRITQCEDLEPKLYSTDCSLLFCSLLMSEPEIQPFIALIFCSIQICLLFFSRHRWPNLLPAIILPDIIKLGQDVEYDIQGNNSQQYLVATVVIGSIIGAIDVGVDDTAELTTHVIERGSDSAGPNSIGIARLQSDLNGYKGNRGGGWED